MSNVVQIGDLERDFIANWIRDIEDVLEQMSVEPKLNGFRTRIQRPTQSIRKLIAANDTPQMSLAEACELLINQCPQAVPAGFPNSTGAAG